MQFDLYPNPRNVYTVFLLCQEQNCILNKLQPVTPVASRYGAACSCALRSVAVMRHLYDAG
jgi:hypothetical protein